MTRSNDALVCIHEPFGDAFYYGPERMGERFLGDDGKEARANSGFEDVTFGDVVERIETERVEAIKVGRLRSFNWICGFVFCVSCRVCWGGNLVRFSSLFLL